MVVVTIGYLENRGIKMTSNYSLITRFRDIGILLSPLGINEIAFNYSSIMEVIDWCIKNKNIILGGDVYYCVDGYISLTSDSWYYEPVLTNSDVLESAKKARDYIENFYKKNGYDYLYSLVLK